MKHIFFVTLIILSSQITCSSKEISQGCNTFACNLYSQLSKQSGNLFFSPFSIHNALSICYAGAVGETKAEIANVLGNSLSEKVFLIPHSKPKPKR